MDEATSPGTGDDPRDRPGGPHIEADYNVKATVTEAVFDSVIAEYVRRGDEATEGLAHHRDIAYDGASEQRLDVWGIGGDGPRPAFVAIHGGYWKALSRRHTPFMARALADEGVATVSVDYALAPAAALEEIVRQVRAAVAWVYRHGGEHGLDPGRIVVGGSSAGGHLTAMTMIGGWQEDLGLPADVVRAGMPISGLFDLRPLVGSFTDSWLGLDAARAAALSPLLAADRPGPPALVAAAEHDGRGFLRQTRRFHERWQRHSPSELLIVPGRNHYDVFLDLADPSSTLFRSLLGLIRGTRATAPGTPAHG